MQFINNKYTELYNRLIDRAISQNRTKQIGFERHHIIPCSLSGTNTNENLVYLTCREHFICHWLLTKMVIGKDLRKMIYAFWRMVNVKNNDVRYKVTSRTYESAKIKVSIILRNRIVSEETKQKLRNRIVSGETKQKLRNVIRTEETKQKIREKALLQDFSHLKGRKLSEDTKEKLKQANLGNKRSAESKTKQSHTMTGKKQKPRTEEYKQRRRALIAANRKICEHCGNDVTKSTYTRNHGDKCKVDKYQIMWNSNVSRT